MTAYVYSETEPTIEITRVFDAPRELVWRCFTEPKMLTQWWGPRRYITKVHAFDLSVGGKWRMSNSTLDGDTFMFFGEYKEIIAPEKITWTFRYLDYPPSTDTAMFEDAGQGRTRLTAVSRFPAMANRDSMRDSGMEEGATDSYERLDVLLAKLKVAA